ncbi:hypothetical protein LCGC14_2694460 [marine sediment metagenome]|uniref:Uncharacterized protein n=1 Tax=marine sediment metagenome TaxID=412755 RepID=A0A0F9BS17_9ZZZZ
MSRETTHICDRCGFRAPDTPSGRPGWSHITKDLAILLGLNPLQEGDLCPTCAASLRNWWGSGK